MDISFMIRRMTPIPMMKKLFKAPHPVPVKEDDGTVAALTEKDCSKECYWMYLLANGDSAPTFLFWLF
ncbi:hypothetical protein NSQ61_05440 [Aeribacillus sp. FSL K6-1121]|uniref:hypothetical protein n=1 Tax=Aeribacillus sp. FSL K6-1121 TaxID=2954745 RepID=UPI0030F65ABA